MATRPKSAGGKPAKQDREILGRSAATGRFVLKPASKPGTISLAQATAAVRRIQEAKNK